jgi:hypothetical protein
MLGGVQFRFENMVDMVIYNKFKYYGKIIAKSNGPIIFNIESFPFFENRDNDCSLPRFRKSVLRKAKVKDKSKYRYKNFKQVLITKPGIPSSPTNFVSRSRYIAL